MQKIIWIKLLLVMALSSCTKVGEFNGGNGGNQPEPDPEDTLVGEVLPDWGEGYLDIHAINTGRGESTFFILPDGTSMLVDVSSSLISPTNEYPPPPRKPNDLISSGKAISNYIKHFLPENNQKLDYIVLSHFHPDHMGGQSNNMPTGPGGDFTMNGVTEIGVEVPFDVIIDRGYPDYDFPSDMTNSALMTNYINFVDWAKNTQGVRAEQFEVGRNDQIVLKKNPSQYDFNVQNIAVNGKVWTGSGSQWTLEIPENLDELNAADPNANIFSGVFELSYGKFNYFTGGDIQFNGRTQFPWKDIESPISQVVSKVDVMKANHHGTSNCNGDELLGKLRPDVVLCHTWRDVHPNPATIDRFFASNDSSKIFLTNLDAANRQKLGSNAGKLKSTHGHIVVRVSPDGSEYSVFVLDDTNENYTIKAVHGPYVSQ